MNISVENEIIKILDQLYIDARYPGDLGLMPDGKPGIEDAIIFQKTAEDIYNRISLFLEKR